MKAMNQMFGDFGNKTQIDLIKYRKSDFRAFIRTQSKYYSIIAKLISIDL
jgi:hypothetical protein